jgi:hypothetical protein
LNWRRWHHAKSFRIFTQKVRYGRLSNSGRLRVKGLLRRRSKTDVVMVVNIRRLMQNKRYQWQLRSLAQTLNLNANNFNAKWDCLRCILGDVFSPEHELFGTAHSASFMP